MKALLERGLLDENLDRPTDACALARRVSSSSSSSSGGGGGNGGGGDWRRRQLTLLLVLPPLPPPPSGPQPNDRRCEAWRPQKSIQLDDFLQVRAMVWWWWC